MPTNAQHHGPVGQIIQRQRHLQEAAIDGQQHFHQRQRQNQRQQGDQYGLAQKLGHQLAAGRAHAFAQGDFARPHRGPRGRQIHEIEAGDQQDQKPDCAHAIKRRPASCWLHPEIAVGGQMRIAEGRQPRLHDLAAGHFDVDVSRQASAERSIIGLILATTWAGSAPGASATYPKVILLQSQLCLAS